jgi:hypothetical protein
MTSLDIWRPSGALALLDKPVSPLVRALGVARRCQAQAVSHVAHHAEMVRVAASARAEHLGRFLAADASARALRAARERPLDPKVVTPMIVATVKAFGGAKALGGESAVKETMRAIIDVLTGDAIAMTTEMWLPVLATVPALALACRSLIATKTFVPKPCEFADEVRKAAMTLWAAETRCEAVVDYVRSVDAVLLEFAPEQWREPYLTEEFRPALPRMLELHDAIGDGTVEFNHDDEPNGFRKALAGAKAALPDMIEAASESKKLARRTAKRLAINRSAKAAARRPAMSGGTP